MSRSKKSKTYSPIDFHAFKVSQKYVTFPVIVLLFAVIIYQRLQISRLEKSAAVESAFRSRYADQPAFQVDQKIQNSTLSFQVYDNTSSFISIPYELLPQQNLKIWKWRSSLNQFQCERAIDGAENVGDWGEYSRFGKDTPTKDLSIDKLPYDVAKPFETFLHELAPFIAERFLVKLNKDGKEYRTKDGKPWNDFRNKDYGDFLVLKGVPFIIKYDSVDSKTKDLKAHKDNSDVSFIAMLSGSNEFADGGTYFHIINRTFYLERGEVLVFSGQLVHEAVPISRGKRYVLSGFLNFADDYLKMKRLGTLATLTYLH